MAHPDATGLSPGDRTFVDLVRAHQAPLWRYVRFLGSDETQADDLVQETFLAVWKKPFENRGPAAARSYLRRVARNLFLVAARRRRAGPVFQDLEAAEAAWCAYDADDGDGYRSALAACIETLSDRARRALHLFYGEEAGRSRIAESMGMAVDGVKTLLRRARETLRTCIRSRLVA